RPELAFFFFLPLSALVFLLWWMLNWFLSLAGMFAVRDTEDAVSAIAAAVGFCRQRTGPVFAVSAWTGLSHLVAFVAATTVIFMPLGFIAIVPWRVVVALMLLATLTYFAVADWLYTVRLAGYVCIAETPAELLAHSLLVSNIPTVPRSIPIQGRNTIDRDELILSDRFFSDQSSFEIQS
ncbi:MAG TPA: hypothetical protein VI386_03590, partial [Candidatus Sulfotelmatobacter sp.]